MKPYQENDCLGLGEIEGLPGLGTVAEIHLVSEEEDCYIVEYEEGCVSFFYYLSCEEGISFHFSVLCEVAKPLQPIFEECLNSPVWVADLENPPYSATFAPNFNKEGSCHKG